MKTFSFAQDLDKPSSASVKNFGHRELVRIRCDEWSNGLGTIVRTGRMFRYSGNAGKDDFRTSRSVRSDGTGRDNFGRAELSRIDRNSRE